MAQGNDWDPYQELRCVEAFCDTNWGEFTDWLDEQARWSDESSMFDYCQFRSATFESFADSWIEEVGHADLLDEREEHN